MGTSTRPLAALVYAALALTWLSPALWASQGKGKAPANPKKQPAGNQVFGLTKVHDFHIELSAKEWDNMQAVKGGMPFGPKGGGPKKSDKKDDQPPLIHRAGGWGTEYPWAKGDFTAFGRTYPEIGIRYRGNFTYMASSTMLRRPMQIDLEHFHDGKRLDGLKKLNLGNGVIDTARMREALSFAVFRAAGVPAPRTAYVQLSLTVPGKYDKEYVGLYTLLEHVGKPFLKKHFKSAKGMLCKPEGLQSLDYLGEDWARYEPRYRPKDEPTKEQKKRLIDFARLINKADDEQFRKEIASYLDMEPFLRFLAVNALLVNHDSFIGLGHNYLLYLRPDTNKFVFIPWDLDLSFAAFPMGGTAEQQLNLSLSRPYFPQHKLIDRLLATKDVSAQYSKIVKEIATTCFTREKLLQDIEALEQATKAALAREKKAAEARKEKGGFGFGGMGGMGGMFSQMPTLRTFVEKRTASIVAQLDGKSQGHVPTGFGFFGGPKGKGDPKGKGGFGIGNFWAKPLIEALDSDKDSKLSKAEVIAGVKTFFADCDKDKKGAIDEAALAEGISRVIPRPKFGGGFGGPKGPKGGKAGKGGFAFFGKALAGAILKRAGAKDGKVTLDQLIAAAETLFKETDKDNKGNLDETGVAAGINALMPPPPAFGPPGGAGGPGAGASPQPKTPLKKEGQTP